MIEICYKYESFLIKEEKKKFENFFKKEDKKR
jgi:hypothetical protein